MRLADSLEIMENKLATILRQVRELKLQVETLESEADMLRNELVRRCEQPDGGWESLQKLYDEGFHICPAQFARRRSREEGCLFCRSFLTQVSLPGSGEDFL